MPRFNGLKPGSARRWSRRSGLQLATRRGLLGGAPGGGDGANGGAGGAVVVGDDDDDGDRQTDSEDDVDDGSDADSDDDDDDDDEGADEDEEGGANGDGEDVGGDGDVLFLGDEDEEEEVESDPDDDAFVKEFEQMMSNEIQARRNDTATTSSIQKLDVAIPMHLKGSKPKQVEDGAATGEENMVFTLLNRKGKEQKTTQLVVPIASGLADRMMARQEAEARERRQNARFVSGYVEQELQKEFEAEEMDYQASFGRGGGGGGRGGGGRGKRQGIRLFSSASGRGRGRGGYAGRGVSAAREKRKKDQEFLRGMGYAKTSKPPSQHQEYRGGPIPSSATEAGDW